MTKHKRSPYVVPAQDLDAVRRLQELRRSGAAGKHADKREKRTRTRSAKQRAALKDW
jgi:hypothetical protein